MKSCTKCHTQKPDADFYKKNTTRDGRMSHCKECHKAMVRAKQTQDYWTNVEVVHRQRARKYGLTPEELHELIDEARGICKLCGREKPLSVDHDHATLVIRGMLCMSCNTKLGWLEGVGVKRVMGYLGV